MELKKKSPKESAEIAKLEAEKEELLNDLQRTRADFENFRKQVEIQREQAKKLSQDATVMKILPLIDDMSRAISANADVLAPVAKTLEKTMSDLGLSRIEPSEGTEFNPDFHDPRLPKLLLHYKGRNYPRSLSEAEAKEYEEYRRERIKKQTPKFLAELEHVAGQDDFVAEELKLYFESLLDTDY